jgi:putative salt-induced outer membrane protein
MLLVLDILAWEKTALRYLVFAFLMVCVALPTFSRADEVVLNNGDHLTGEIVKFDGSKLTFNTKYAGNIEIDWKAVTSLSSEKPVYVQTGPMETVSGVISTQDDRFVVKPASGAPQTIARSSVQALRSPGEQSAYELQQHPGLLQGWTANVNAGFGLTGGNSQTRNLSIGFNAVRAGKNDKITSYTNAVYATDNLATPNVTANVVQGGARYDHNFDGILFGFGSGDFMSDALQSLNLRSVFSGGLGYHAIRKPNTTLDFLTGINYTRENYVTLSRNIAAATLGEQLMHKLAASTVLNEAITFYPDFNYAGQYRANVIFGTATKINKWLGWQNNFSDVYVTNPPAGKLDNDVLFTTGLNISFSH